MIGWMSYVIIVGLCVVVAAWSVEGLARMRGRPARFVWIGAAALCVVLAATAPVRARAAPRMPGRHVDISAIALMQTGIQSVDERVPASGAWYAGGLWGLATILVTSAFMLAHRRLRRARRAWPMVELHGHRVFVAPTTGPLVIGVARPEIIVPRWVLSRSPDEQRVILVHEAAHVRAGDPVVLSAMCALVALMPWNPALWMILSRLRLAIEIDCDARVLRGGVSPRSYGSLLVDVAEQASPLLLRATALTDGSSHLHQRILAMQPRRFTYPILRGASVALVGLAGLLAACEAKMPTATEISHMDARSAEQGARALGLLPDSSVSWLVDGIASTEVVAKQIPRDSIASVSVNKSAGRSQIYITTKRSPSAAVGTVSQTDLMPRRRVGASGDTLALTRTVRELTRTGQSAASRQPEPMLLIDGIRSERSALTSIDRTRIESVEVLKGALAIETYGADAKNGVIVVKTKR